VRLQCMVPSPVKVTFPRSASPPRFLQRTVKQWIISTARLARSTVRLLALFFFFHFGGVAFAAVRVKCRQSTH